MNHKSRVTVVLAACTVLLFPVVGLGSDEAPSDPEVFAATVMIINAPKTGMARLRMTVEHWTTDEERAGLLEALGEGGTEALVKAMRKLDAGYLQVENNLRWPIRVASTWETDEGRFVRIATNRPIYFGEYWKKGTRTEDYPVGVVEFKLPSEGTGEGTLLVATRIEFDKKGRIEVRSLPQNTGPQNLVDVTRETPKKSKNKKKGK
jgi:hypothetical protein